MSAADNVDGLLDPRSIAIVGASDRGDSPGARLTAALLGSGFEKPIYAVNPRRLDLPSPVRWVESAAAIEEPIDLAAFAVPAGAAVEGLEVLAARGLRAAIVYSSGFGEAGEEGAALERRLVAVAREHGVSLCGPNTAGVISMPSGFIGSFTHALHDGAPARGSLLVVTQSGAMGGLMLTRLRERGVGISHWISVGNGAVLDVPDYLAFAAADPATEEVALFLEGINDGARFRAAVAACRAAGKRISAFKVGASEEGARAARSHTGKLAGSDDVYSGIFRQAGVERVGSLAELADLAMVESWLGEPRGRRGAILSVSGAGCTILADELSRAGLGLARFEEGTATELQALLPGFSQQANPVDLTGAALIDLDVLRGVIRATLADPGVDFLVLGFATNVTAEFAAAVDEAWDREKPLVVVLPVDHAAGEPMRRVLSAKGVPSFQEFAAAAQTLRRYVGAAGAAPAPGAAGHRLDDDDDGADGEGWVAGNAALELLADDGVPVVRGGFAATPAAAAATAAAIGEQVVIKVDHPRVLHKTEIGGVRLGVAPARAEAVCEELREAVERGGVEFEPDGRFLVQEQVEDGFEALVGLVTDPTFGPVVTIGVGGTLVEALDEVAFRGLPLDRADVEAAIAETRLGELLAEHRQGARDSAALVEAILAFARGVEAGGAVREADLNPVLVRGRGDGCVVVDARLLVDGRRLDGSSSDHAGIRHTHNQEER